MTFKVLADAVDDKLAAIALVFTQMEQGGESAVLRELAGHLMGALALFQRNPGIEAAADDLYAATAALIADSTPQSQPMARKRRLLQEAQLRFTSRLTGAAERLGPYEHMVVPVREAA